MSFSKVLNLAEQMEKTGETMYRRFADIADDRDVAALFVELADQELEHGRTFRELRERFDRGEEPGGTLTAEQNRRLEKVLATADRRNLGVVLQESFPAMSVEELLHRSIEMEKSVVAFFSQTRSALSDSLGRRAVDAIIAEELSHIDWLNKRRPS